jgi:hypothetical protein
MVAKPDDIHEALEVGKAYEEVMGILIILGDKLGVWGALDLVKV